MKNTKKDDIRADIEEVIVITGIGASVCHIWYGLKIHVLKILRINILETATILAICLILYKLYKEHILD